MFPEVDSKLLGQRIRQKRKELQMTQNQLSEKCGVSLNMISHIEVGQSTPSLNTLLRISLALKASIDYLLLDTSYVLPEIIISEKISEQLKQCEQVTLQATSKIIDVLLQQQNTFKSKEP